MLRHYRLCDQPDESKPMSLRLVSIASEHISAAMYNDHVVDVSIRASRTRAMTSSIRSVVDLGCA